MLRAAFAAVLALAMSAVPSTAEDSRELSWETDWKAARKRAAEEMRPVLLDFAADWCGPCGRMDAEFWPRPDVRTLTDRFVRIRVDFDDAAVLRQRYAIGSIPNVLILDPWGTRLGQLVGWGGEADQHLVLLRAIPADFAPFAAEARAAAAGNADGNAYERLGETYFPGVLAGASRDYFQKAVKSRELKSDPARLARTQARLGWCEMRLGELGLARKWFEKSLDAGAGRSDLALAGLAITYARQGKPDRAALLREELHKTYPGSALLPLVAEQLAKDAPEIPAPR